MPRLRVLLTAAEIDHRVKELAAQIDADCNGDVSAGPIYLVGVLKGSCMFLADLSRALKTSARLDFIAASSYGASNTSSGEVRILKDLDESIEGCNVILVEDIVDTGITLSYLVDVLERRKPKSLRVAAILDKPSRRQRAVRVDYVGFAIPDAFVVGYGLDYAQDYRNLADVCVLED
jgi:hypoxanthine phosphoribosyltransferase